MRSRRFMVAGILCLLLGGGSFFAGFRDPPWLMLASGILGTVFLMGSLIGVRSESARATTHDPARGVRLVRVASVALAGLGIAAGLVAVLVAEGEARGHAVAHILAGLVCLGLFASLAFPWHPPAGSTLASLRGLVLTLLAAAAFGSFLESIGGSGYDSANDGTRIAALTTLHGIAAPFGALVIGAVPLGLITAISVLIDRAIHRGRPVRI